jgi:hypothetical protein
MLQSPAAMFLPSQTEPELQVLKQICSDPDPHPQLFEGLQVAPPTPSWHSSLEAIQVSPHGFPSQHTGLPLFDMFFHLRFVFKL